MFSRSTEARLPLSPELLPGLEFWRRKYRSNAPIPPKPATLVRASRDTKARLGVFHPEPGPLAALAQGLRIQFDPRSILNRGMMG